MRTAVLRGAHVSLALRGMQHIPSLCRKGAVVLQKGSGSPMYSTSTVLLVHQRLLRLTYVTFVW